MPEAIEWSRAFASPPRADLSSYAVCCITPAVPPSHRFHFLQIACEKLAKAFLCGSGSDPAAIQASHAYTAKVLPVPLRQEVATLGPAGERRLAWLVDAARPLLREIELLSPAVDDGGSRPANCEYPWVDAAGILRGPAAEAYPNLSSLYSPMGRELLRTLERAAVRLAAG